MAYEKLHMHKYTFFSGDMTQMVLPFYGTWYTVRQSLALNHGQVVLLFPALFDGVASYLK